MTARQLGFIEPVNERVEYTCYHACATPGVFTIGDRVRFIEFPSLVCTVTATGTDPETGKRRYQLEGREGALGCWYVQDDLEAAT